MRLKARPRTDRRLEAERHLLEPASNAGVPVGVGFPSSYHVGMSNLGYQQLYRACVEHPDLLAERIFADSVHPGAVSLESGWPMGAFRILFFSLSFEFDYILLLRLFKASGIPVHARDRTGRDPLVVLGGMAITANPAPLAPLADVIFFGEIEEQFPALVERLLEAVEDHDRLPGALAEVPGVWLPQHHPPYDQKSVRPNRVADMEPHPVHSVILTPNTIFENMFLTEVGRGCERACRFCLVGYLTPRLRMRSADALLGEIHRFTQPGDKVGLISAELSTHPEIERILEETIRSGRKVSLSSVEIDRVNPRIAELMAATGQESVTIAPEGGNEEIRKLIHKAYSDEQILGLARYFARTSIRKLKCYFIIGIPAVEAETEARAIVEMSLRIAEAFRDPPSVNGKPRMVTISASPLVPKPYTPFGKWYKMMTPRELKERINIVRKGLAGKPGIKFQPQSITQARMDYEICQNEQGFERLLEQA